MKRGKAYPRIAHQLLDQESSIVGIVWRRRGVVRLCRCYRLRGENQRNNRQNRATDMDISAVVVLSNIGTAFVVFLVGANALEVMFATSPWSLPLLEQAYLHLGSLLFLCLFANWRTMQVSGATNRLT